MTDRPMTIDSKGNVIEKPYGLGRWHSTRVRPCAHEDCEDAAVVLRLADESIPKAHNCCTEHK